MEELDLHFVRGDPDFGIASEGKFISDISEIISFVSKVKDTVKSINLNNQAAIKEIPEVIGECKQIEKLNISHTGITEIPDFIFTLPNLQNLSCCCSEVHEFPIGVFKAQKLKRLHIRINKDWKMPKEIAAMPDLETLLLDLYTSSDMPNNLGVLKKLKQLIIAAKYTEGDVPDLPSSLAKHPSLKELSYIDPFYRYRKNFNMDTAVKTLSSCHEFNTLKLSGFSVGKGHKALSALKNLKKLALSHLLVDGDIFASVKDLHQLEVLGIWGSEFRINTIPDIFSNMQDLQEFSFAGNIVTQLPPSIYTLSKLKTLAIGSTGVTSIDDKIGDLQNLEKLHVYDCLLEKLPDSVLKLPNLKTLNIEENVFKEADINQIKAKVNSLKQEGKKIELICGDQGYRQMVKKLRVFNIKAADAPVDKELYNKFCQNAVKESPHAIKYVNARNLHKKHYAEICMQAIRRTGSAALLNFVTGEALGRHYFPVCMEGARSPEIGDTFNLIRDDLLSDNEYVQVCIEAALHNKSADFINNINTEAFQKRFKRDIYERICWVAALHNPNTISKIKR